MKHSDAARLARELMNQHGLGHVPFQFNNRRRSFGVTKFVADEVRIELSAPLVELNEEADVRDTILHEIAHAKAGHAAGHGYQWKIMARSIGCDAERCCGEGVKTAAGKWQSTCGCAGKVHNMYRRPSRNKICRYCRVRLTFIERV
jgi:SprT protein